MANKPKSKKRDEIEFQGYIDVRFKDDVKKEFVIWRKGQENAVAMINEYTENSYRVSFFYDDENRCAKCTLMATDKDDDNAGWILVGRGQDAEDAFWQAVFKDREVTLHKWSDFGYTREADWK